MREPVGGVCWQWSTSALTYPGLAGIVRSRLQMSETQSHSFEKVKGKTLSDAASTSILRHWQKIHHNIGTPLWNRKGNGCENSICQIQKRLQESWYWSKIFEDDRKKRFVKSNKTWSPYLLRHIVNNRNETLKIRVSVPCVSCKSSRIRVSIATANLFERIQAQVTSSNCGISSPSHREQNCNGRDPGFEETLTSDALAARQLPWWCWKEPPAKHNRGLIEEHTVAYQVKQSAN